MSKKVYRFFGGLLKAQEKWLNEMADKGYRLVGVSKASYEFEECKPGQYRYAVEFVGEKSQKDVAEYAAFLENCGYHVLYKNLNLDYSVAKAVFRPWAKKGGRIATTAGAYNRELLLVEKENDGKPFELHTTEEDRREYRKIVRKPWIFLIASILIVVILMVGTIALASSLDVENTRSATRIAYVGNAGRSNWSGRYAKMDGTMSKTIVSSDGELEISIETVSGSIAVEVYDRSDNLLFREENVGTREFTVEVPKKVKVKVIGQDHEGKFNVEG